MTKTTLIETVADKAGIKKVDAEKAVYDNSSGMKYGDNRGVGGAITTDVKFDLTGYEGQTITIKLYGTTKFGKTVCVAIINNVTLASAE